MIDRIYALRKSLHNYANGGYVLIAVTVLAMVIANSPLQTLYFSWWERPVLLQIGDFNLFGYFLFFRRIGNKAGGLGRRVILFKKSSFAGHCSRRGNRIAHNDLSFVIVRRGNIAG